LQEGKTPAYYHNKSNRSGKTITISASGASAGYVAFHSRPIFASDCSTISENKNFDIQYLYYSLKNLQDKIYQAQTGGAQPHIHPKDIAKIQINFPVSLDEQKAIAQVLSDMETEIEHLELVLNKFLLIKQGMMKELLTGRIRLI
jgi:type I restriction enzyme S subunit